MPQEVLPPAAQQQNTNTILIVEDDADIARFLQQLVEEETPYQPVVFYNGFEALEKAPSVRPCLLLLNYRLPGINGLELYDRLQEVKELRGVPAVMMSATLPVAQLEKRGIYQLHKPMDIGSVIRMITHAMASYEEKALYDEKGKQEEYNRA